MKGSPFQGHLAAVIREIFPNKKILTNARKGAALVNPATGKYLELDIIVPSHKICFEFQDIYHYTTTWYSQRLTNPAGFKSGIVRSSNYTLIVVPCWWDGTKESLEASIHFQRPELIKAKVKEELIPLNSPLEHFTTYIVPDVGEVMLASFAANFSEDFISLRNPWWVGEKYDGVRCIWNSTQNTLRGLPINMLYCHRQLFIKSKTFLDGEIWYGRGNYLDSYRLLKSNIEDIEFAFLRIPVFDAPAPSILTLPFEKRYKHLLDGIDSAVPFITIAVRSLATSKKYLSDSLQSVIYNNGEGLMLRKPKTYYEHGRSNSLIKLKIVRGDTEALVVGIEHPWVQLKLPSGVKFNVEEPGLEDLKIGEVVTLAYESFSQKEVPVAPKITRARKDVEWEDVMSDYLRENHEKTILNKLSRVEPTLKRKSPKEESLNESEWQKIFETFARSRRFDPRNIDTWYSMPYSYYFQDKDVRAVLRNFNGDIITTLKRVFPNMKFEIIKFQYVPGMYWNTVNNRKELFQNLSFILNLNPLIPENWYSVKHEDIVSKRAIMSLVNSRYGGQVGNALHHLFPDINFDKRRFNSIFYWNGVRDFFKEFAKMKQFDYKVPDNWYSVTLSDVWSVKDARIHLAHYKGNVAKTLIHAFPDLGLTESRFSSRFGEYWSNRENRRNFFEKFAATSEFDPLVAHNWYRVRRAHITSVKGAIPVLHFHDNDHIMALVQLFPEVYFDKSLFIDVNYWQNPRHRRSFFEEIASKNEFNYLHPSNWYSFTRNQIYQIEDGNAVLNFHRNSVSLALIQLFPEVSFDKSKFQDDYWNDEKNRALFFEDFAKTNSFDPFIPSNWYSFSNNNILVHPNGSIVLEYHQNNFIIALVQLFPHIRFDRTQFKNNHWGEASNRRKYMNRIAYKNGFDSLSPESWYSFNPSSLLNDPDARMVLSFHNNNLVSALRSLFPLVRFNSSKFLFATKEVHQRIGKPVVLRESSQTRTLFDTKMNGEEEEMVEVHKEREGRESIPSQPPKKTKSKQYWTDEKNRRSFFIDFAKAKNFDPQIPSNWYSYSYWDIRNQKKSSSVLSYYRGSHKSALLHLFPNIGLDVSKFVH